MQSTAHPFLSKKNTVVLIVLLFSIVLLGVGYFVFIQKGFFEKNTEIYIENFDKYNVSTNKREIQFLCYLTSAENQLGKCFNVKEKIFEYVPREEISEYSLDEEIFLVQEAMQLLHIDPNKKEISLVSEDISIYEKGLINLLNKTDLEDFVIKNSTDTEDVYINFYDYISVNAILLKYYGEINEQEEIIKRIEDLNSFIYKFENNNLDYILLYPSDRENIKIIEDFDSELSDKISEISDLQVDYIYENTRFFIGREKQESSFIGFDSSLLSEFVDLYKAESSINPEFDLYDEYKNVFEEYKNILLKKLDLSRNDLLIWVKYIPIEDPDILKYFIKIYSQDEETFYKELVKTDFYILNNNLQLVDKYKISNVLYKNLKNINEKNF
jgi:hypothetical protein